MASGVKKNHFGGQFDFRYVLPVTNATIMALTCFSLFGLMLKTSTEAAKSATLKVNKPEPPPDMWWLVDPATILNQAWAG